MEDYIKTSYQKSSQLITESESRRLSSLFAHDRGIESFRVSPEGVYLEYNSYIYSSDQLEKVLQSNGFSKEKEPRQGFLMKQIRHLADSNKKTYGNRKPDCCSSMEYNSQK